MPVLWYTIYMKDIRCTYNRTSVYRIGYHIVWCVRYRNRILTPEIEEALRRILREVASENGFEVVDTQVREQDHVHCFVSAPPKLSVTFIVKHLKGTSAIRLFREFPHLRDTQKRHKLWNPSYFVETVGSTSEENVRRYIAAQKKGAQDSTT